MKNNQNSFQIKTWVSLEMCCCCCRDSKIYGNCFSNSTDETGTDTYCTAGVLSCQAFQRYIAANGELNLVVQNPSC